ncbi:MAG: hypothetical protein ACI4JC_04295 [Faecalibacterium sp.]
MAGFYCLKTPLLRTGDSKTDENLARFIVEHDKTEKSRRFFGAAPELSLFRGLWENTEGETHRCPAEESLFPQPNLCRVFWNAAQIRWEKQEVSAMGWAKYTEDNIRISEDRHALYDYRHIASVAPFPRWENWPECAPPAKGNRKEKQKFSH